jgi:phage internal scaffolding protein
MSKRIRVTYKSDLPSKTQQHFKEQCDVNLILKKYEKTGMITHTKQNQGSYGDFSQYNDFQTNLNIVKDALDSFDALPSEIRKRFANNPTKLLEFIHDDSNRDEAEKLGLVAKREQPQAAQNDDKTTTTQAPSAPLATPAQ